MKILPNYEKHPTWERYEKELDVEYKQSVEEGKDIEQYKELFETIFRLPEGEYKEKLAVSLLSRSGNIGITLSTR